MRLLTGHEPGKNLNPDECVALGASIQGGKLAGETGLNEVLLMDVTPLTLSIETVGGVATPLIQRNSTIPTRYSQIFTTAGNFQTTVEIKVLQGERQFAKDNKLIGNFKLNGIKRAPRGVPQIEVTFDIDVNGILSVSAKDLGTGRQQSVTITASSNLSDEEIESAVRDAQAFEATDGERKEAVAAYNEAENLMLQVEGALASKAKKQISREEKNQIKLDLANLKKVMKKIKLVNITPADGVQIKMAKEALERSAGNLMNMAGQL